MFNITYKTYSKYTAYVLVFLMFLVSFGNAGLTNAYYSDIETTGENIFTATLLDFVLTNPVNNFGGLTPNNSTSAFLITIATSTDSLPFEYVVSISNPTGSLCGALTLEGLLEGIPVGNSALGTFFVSTTTFPLQGDQWSFVASLGAVDSSYSNASCAFDVIYDGWQFEFSEGKAFHDSEKITLTITAGSWEDTPDAEAAVSDIAAIMDADVSEHQTNSNNGGSQQMEIKRDAGKDSEAYIGFDFVLPAGSDVTGAELKAYLYQAPTPNTTYAASRVTGSWTEGGITWNTKPARVFSDSTSTGDGNAKWLAWDVEDDVQDIVDGINPNYGWAISDIDPISGSRSGKFRSSEHQSQEGIRPVLEVTFDAPIATTNHMVINEVFYDVDSNHGSDANNEWIELYNPTSDPISIQNWDICDGVSCVDIGVSTTVPAYGFAVITEDASTFTEWSIPAGANKIALNVNIGGGLNNGGDRMILKDAADAIVDHVSFGTDTYSFNPAVAITGLDGKSIARVVKGWDTDTQDDWILNATPNPGTNPGSDEIEILRFTATGVEVASISEGLEELPELSDAELAALMASEVVMPEEEMAVPLTEVEAVKPEEVQVQESAATEESGGTGDGDLQQEEDLAPLPEEIIEAREEDVVIETPQEESTVGEITEEQIIEEEAVEEKEEAEEETEESQAVEPESSSVPTE